MRAAQALLTTDGAALFCYGAISLLLAPGSPGEAYVSSGRLLYGVLPIVLELGSLVCAVRLSFRARTD
jgi:hypothetical protein